MLLCGAEATGDAYSMTNLSIVPAIKLTFISSAGKV